MPKRFTDTDIWDKEWFMLLSCKHKCLVRFLFDKCDVAGVWSANWMLASSYIGEQINEEDIEIFSGHVVKLSDTKFLIIDFIEFQYGTLSENCKPHGKVIALLKKYNIDFLKIKGYTKVIHNLQEEEEDKEEEKEKEKYKEEGNFFEKSESTEPPLPAKMQSLWINALKGKYVSMPSNDMPVILEVLNFIFEQETGIRKSFCDYAPEETEMVLSEWQKWIDWYKENGNNKSLDTIINKFKMIQQIQSEIKNGKNAAVKNFSSGSIGKITGASGGLNVIAKVREELLRGRT